MDITSFQIDSQHSSQVVPKRSSVTLDWYTDNITEVTWEVGYVHGATCYQGPNHFMFPFFKGFLNTVNAVYEGVVYFENRRLVRWSGFVPGFNNWHIAVMFDDDEVLRRIELSAGTFVDSHSRQIFFVFDEFFSSTDNFYNTSTVFGATECPLASTERSWSSFPFLDMSYV